MDGDKLNNWGHPPASTPLVQQNDEFSSMNIVNDGSAGAFNNSRSVRTNQAVFPLNPSSTTSFPWRQMHGAYQTYPYAPSDTSNGLMVDLNQPPNSQDLLHDLEYMNVTPSVPNFYLQHYPHSLCENKVGAIDNVMNVSPQFSSFWNPGSGGNSSIVRSNACEIIDLTSEDNNPDFGNTHETRAENNPRVPGAGKTVLYHPQNTGGTNSLSEDWLNAIQFGTLRRVDENFLSLGNEYKSNAVSNSDLASRVTVGDQVRGIYSPLNLYHRQAESYMNIAPNLGGFSGFQNDAGGLTSSHCSMGRFSSSRNYVGGLDASIYNVATLSSADYLSNSSSSHVIQRPQANKEHGFPRSSNSDLDFMSNADSSNANVDPHASLRDRLSASAGPLPLCNNSAGFHHPAQTGVSGVAPSSVNFLRTAAQVTLDQYQKLFQESVRNNLAGNISFNQYTGSPANQSYPGRTISSSENHPHFQASDFHAVPPIKRSMIHPDPSLPWAQRRRMTLHYPSPPYVSSRPQTAPICSVHVPASRGGSGRVPKPSGRNCMLCKRDLAFAPEGPIRNPTVPPIVAVLPCQHTFHDHCLQRITPDDQAKNPPCMPCAMGEK